MRSEEPFSQHDPPEVKRRFIGIGKTVIVKREESAIPQRLISDTEVPQFV